VDDGVDDMAGYEEAPPRPLLEPKQRRAGDWIDEGFVHQAVDSSSHLLALRRAEMDSQLLGGKAGARVGRGRIEVEAVRGRAEILEELVRRERRSRYVEP
jgi:hypothetical protein